MSDEQSLKNFFATWRENEADGRAVLAAPAIGDGFHYANPHVPEPITSAKAMPGIPGRGAQ
ncbi:MAG: hypothetical protein GY717_12130 [Rhodobacteraceae bacterium]|nr:hypothetical protein [Paracoccaceae bacterium]